MSASSGGNHRTRLTPFAVAGVLGLLAVSAAPSAAQVPASDPDAAQVVGLFEQSCMRFAGNTAELRNWIAAHHLPRVPTMQAARSSGSVAGGVGQVFGASTASGNYAVVSYDNGTCQVIAMSGNNLAVQQSLLALLARLGLAVIPVLDRRNPMARRRSRYTVPRSGRSTGCCRSQLILMRMLQASHQNYISSQQSNNGPDVSD